MLVITVCEADSCSYLSLGKISNVIGGAITDSEQVLKQKLAKKIEDNPNVHKVLQRHDGHQNLSLNLTPQTIKILH